MNDNNKLIYWCANCKIPIVKGDDKFFYKCPICNDCVKYLSKDIRPVFPEERLLFEIITNQKAHTYMKSSVWCNGAMYYIDGIKYKLDNDVWKNINPEDVRSLLDEYGKTNTYQYFNKFIENFINANKIYLNSIRYETTSFIRSLIKSHPNIPKYISFSGGKDSTVCADLVIKSLGHYSILHVFCNTTLEYPYTLEYIKRLRENNPKMVIKEVRNKEHDFYEICDDIGVPSSPKRWCCTIFKTGPISKKLKALFGDKKLIYFNGIRKSESTLRSKYERISSSNKQKIQNQLSISPIINWKEIDVWLYILNEHIDFNYAYRLGFSRVGCYCCPNSSVRNETLSMIYMNEKAKRWSDYLFQFANKIGAENPYDYVHKGLWKSKQGGKGIKSYNEVSFSNKVCTIDENSVSYDLGKNIDEEFYTLFVPFGRVCKNLGRKLLNEVLVLKGNVPIIAIQVENETTVKIKTMNVSDHQRLRRLIENQLTKFKLCRRCYKCEAVCTRKAISIEKDKYLIDENKCSGCLACTKEDYIYDGCMMKRYLRISKGEK